MLESVSMGGIRILTSPAIRENHGIFIGFTSRDGGVSAGKFRSLNLSYKVGDESRNVARNRVLLGSSIGIPPDRWVAPRQIHGTHVKTVYDSDAGKGGVSEESAVSLADGLITSYKELALIVLVADCVPVLLFEHKCRVVAAVHAGWRGVLGGIAVSAVRKMRKYYGCGPSKISAILGPHIGPCCFEVGHDLAKRFEEEIGQSVVRQREDDGYFVNLGKALSFQLEFEGLKPNHICFTGKCTCCEDDYFSYRRDGGTTGRQCGIIFSF